MHVSYEEPKAAAHPVAADIETLYRQHASWVLALCRRWLNNPLDAEDACQETFLRASNALEQFRGESSLRWWLSVIARNECRKLGRRRSFDSASLEVVPEPEISPGADDEAERRSLVNVVHQALATLPDRDRDYLILADLRGRSYAELAAYDGASLTAARSHLMRARRRLRRAATAITESQRHWPLPVAVLSLPSRIRAWWNDRAGIRRFVTDVAATPGSPIGSLSAVMTPTVANVAIAVVGTAGLMLGSSAHADAAKPAGATPIAQPTGHLTAERLPQVDLGVQRAPPPRPSARELDDPPRASPPPPSHAASPSTPDAIAAPIVSPRVNSDAEAVAAEPVENESERHFEGYYVRAPDISVDIDGDGEPDSQAGGSAGISCRPGPHQGPVTKTACDGADQVTGL